MHPGPANVIQKPTVTNSLWEGQVQTPLPGVGGRLEKLLHRLPRHFEDIDVWYTFDGQEMQGLARDH